MRFVGPFAGLVTRGDECPDARTIGRRRRREDHETQVGAVLAVERGAPGARYHAVADTGVPFREIADVIGRRLNVPVVSKSAAQAGEHFGWFAMFAGMDAPATSERTRASLDWTPVQPGLLADIDRTRYFET